MPYWSRAGRIADKLTIPCSITCVALPRIQVHDASSWKSKNPITERSYYEAFQFFDPTRCLLGQSPKFFCGSASFYGNRRDGQSY